MPAKRNGGYKCVNPLDLQCWVDTDRPSHSASKSHDSPRPHTHAYMSAETADIPLSVNHPTQGCYIMYNVMCLMYYISCYIMFSTKRYDHLVFTYRLLSTLMLPQHCCTVCITSIIRRVLCFIRIHWNYEKHYFVKKSSYGKRNLNEVKVFLVRWKYQAVQHSALRRKYLLNLCMA